MDRWTEMALFVEVAEQGSLSRAAEAVGLSKASASRHLTALELRLGARLVERNTRRLFLTDVGQVFHRRCRAIMGDLADAESEVNASALNPTGVLRISASLSFCVRHVAPLLPAFTRRYPNVRVDVVVANRYYDLIDNHVDVAIRTREFEVDSSITIRRLAETRRILCASARYLDRAGTPQSVDDLAHHSLLLYTHANHPNELRFTRGNKTAVWRGPGLLEANDGQVLRTAALEGLGILVQPKYIVYDDIVAGRLVPVLEDWDLPRLTINIAYPSRQHLPAKSRAFIDHLVAHFRQMDYERKWST